MKLSLRPCAGEPELSDPAVAGQFAEQMATLAATKQVPPWCGYIGWRESTPLGFGGFTGEPDENGTVEIGYLTFPSHEGQGVACAVAAGLIAIAREQRIGAVIAHSLPEENASTTVLRRNGFARDGEAEDPDEGTVWRWRLELVLEAQMSTEFFPGHGGTRLALHRAGEGRPLVLLHGLFSNAEMNWTKFGHAACLAQAGFEVLMPDLRGHGHSEAPHDPAAYPPDVLARDLAAMVAHLGLEDYDLGGFSLGARTAVRGVIGGLKPRRLVLGGMGLEGLAGWSRRGAFFIDAIDRFDNIKHGDPAYFAVQFMKSMKIDRIAARLLLGTFADTPPEALAALTMPTLVVCGDEDRDNGDPQELVAALRDARLATIPGTHMSCVTKPELGQEIREFLTA